MRFTPSPSFSSAKKSSSSQKANFEIQRPSKYSQIQTSKTAEHKLVTQDISKERVTAINHRLESSRSSACSQIRDNEMYESRKRFPPAEPPSYISGSPTLQRLWNQQTKPYTHHHFHSYPNQPHSYYSSESASESYHGGYHSQSSVREPFYSNSQSSPHSLPNSVEFNHVDCKSEDTTKKRFSSYLKFHLGGGKEDAKRNNGLPLFHRNSSPVSHLHYSQSSQSPEPPPRLNRIVSQNQDGGSPLPLKRGFLDHSPIRRGLVESSPALSRRYISPSPPQPPPRRLSECNSVPGSPQHRRVEHFRTRFHYTPEPQRRMFGPEL